MTWFGAKFNLYTILGANGAIVIFSAFGSNLRHSPIRLSYGRYIETILISPAQHQIHHSTRHMHYNYGGYLAIWDTLFGSLKRNHEITGDLTLGLGKGQHQKYNQTTKLILYPFIDAYHATLRYFRRQQL